MLYGTIKDYLIPSCLIISASFNSAFNFPVVLLNAKIFALLREMLNNHF